MAFNLWCSEINTSLRFQHCMQKSGGTGQYMVKTPMSNSLSFPNTLNKPKQQLPSVAKVQPHETRVKAQLTLVSC